MDLKIAKFNYRQELNQQRELFVECFPENVGTTVETIEHYMWKFRNFPSVKQRSSYEYVAKLDNDIVGYYAALPYEYVVKGEPVFAAMVCDVMTGVKARGKGVFTKLGVYATNEFDKEGFAFSTGYPIRAEVLPGHKKAGWDFPFQIPMYGRFIKFNSFLKSRKMSFLIPFANFLILVMNAFVELINISFTKNMVVEQYASNHLDSIDDLDEFLATWVKEQNISLNKNVKYLMWRLAAPAKKYHILTLRNNTKIVGYAICRSVVKEGVPCMGILDFSVLSAYHKQSYKLMKRIVRIAKEENDELILMMMMKHQASNLKLCKQGFLQTPFPFSFIIKKFKNSPDQNFLNNAVNWNLMWIDSDDL